MLLYKVLVETRDEIELANEKCSVLYRTFMQKYDVYMFVAHIQDDAILMAAISDKVVTEEIIDTFINALQLSHINRYSVAQIDFIEFNDLCRLSTFNRYGRPYEDISYFFNVNTSALTKCFSPVVFEPASKKQITMDLKNTTYQEILKEEINRIYDKRNPKDFIAHPTHYIFTGSDIKMTEMAMRILLQSLYNKNRIKNRYGIIINVSKDTYDYEAIKSAYEISNKSVVIIQIDEECNTNNTSYAFNDKAIDSLNLIAPFINQHKNDVLTIFVLNDRAKNLKNRIYDYCELPFIEIEENMVKNNSAKNVLTTLAKTYDIELNDKLTTSITPNKLYNAKDLIQIASNWFDNRVYNELYPAYNTSITKTTVDTKPIGSAYDELMDMIGLVKVKELINKAINYRNVCKVMEDRKLTTNPNSFHMVFTGNPGTAKTTVARLFAQILKENGVLSEGKLIECGRADLVGKYVGWTADLVKEKFKEAKGSVLFIDEAYSLLDGDHNTFGIEAINCIVQEMENHREDTIVIFAGYPEEMKEFLEKNPGMNSRIAFHINFDNYNEDELFAITELMAKKMALKLDKKVKDLLIPTYKEAMESKSFGNGRYVRNLLENAMLNHCNKISTKDLSTISNEDLVTIQVDDFEITPIEKDKHTIGFR